MNNKEDNCILDVKNLNVHFKTDLGTVKAVNGVDLNVNHGQSIGIVGESGCGKSVTARSILKLLPPAGEILEGEILLHKGDGVTVDVAQLDSEGKKIRDIRGKEISMIFQEPMTAFSPVHTMANQICEAILLHQNMKPQEAREKVIQLFKLVGISNPEQRIDEYSFQFSGGMRQRAMIAMALACNPRLLIADEPTTALDVTIQAQVLNLIKDMQNNFDLSLILITHDLGVVAHMIKYIYIMYLGHIVEEGSVEEIFDNPKHPYTRDLLKSIPKLRGNQGKLSSIKGSVPDSYTLPTGCPFHPRCQDSLGNICKENMPQISVINDYHCVKCFKYRPAEVENNVANVR